MFVRLMTAFVLLLSAIGPAFAEETPPSHGLSLFGSLKYGPDFTRFDYVNPAAPKGGLVRYAAIGGFDSLNPFIVTGRAATGIMQIYDTLMRSSLDEPGSEYGLIAESVSYATDYSSVTFNLRPTATWHDGQPITPEDVLWSLETLKANHPFYHAYYANVVRAEKLSAHQVRFVFSVTGNRELPLIVGQFPILPKHYWQGTDAQGKKRDFTKTTLEPPLGSGPYRIGDIQTNRSITYERVPDYWGKDLPVNGGAHNFDRIRFEYFGDTTVALEAFKAGQVDVRLENSAKNWATGYDFPAIKDGRVKLEKLATKNSEGMQGFVFNTRRDKFKDRRVREAFDWALDFEWLNNNIFYGQYTRTQSYFSNSELAATGLPSPAELAILEPFRGQVPDEVFTQVFKNPTTDGSGQVRQNLQHATILLREAGWILKNGVLTNQKTGEPFEVEFLLADPSFERVVTPFTQNLKKLGIMATIRIIDSAQYQNRTDHYDFDIVVGNFPQSLSPGNEQRDFWGSQAADRPGGRNLIGIKDPVVDQLIDRIILAKDRAELVAATRALDRVLLWTYYVVPQWHTAYERVAVWAYIAHPEPTPAYSIGFPDLWWYEEKAAPKAPVE